MPYPSNMDYSALFSWWFVDTSEFRKINDDYNFYFAMLSIRHSRACGNPVKICVTRSVTHYNNQKIQINITQ